VIIVPYLHPTEAPFSTVHGVYESMEYTIAHGIFPLFTLGIIYLTAITVGRLYCGWACPFGMIQDFMSYLPVKKQKLTPSMLASMRDVKWAVVGFSILTSLLVGMRRSSIASDNPVGAFSDSPFAVISPSGTIFAYIPWMLLWKANVLVTAGMIGWLKIGILLASLVPAVYIPRFFCRFICPLGAILEPFSRFKALRINRAPKLPREDVNKLLAEVCPMGVQLQNDDVDFIDHGSCIHCGKCTAETNLLTQNVVF